MYKILPLILILIFNVNAYCQTILPSSAIKITASDFAQILESPEGSNYVIFNTGPVNDIKNAINIGAVDEKKNVKKLKKQLKKLPKDTPIIYYCGCCPMATCPNLLPAEKLLNQMGFTNYKALDLPKSLKLDWIEQGYPMKNQ